MLLEALIATAIFAIAMLGLIGLQAVSIKNSADAKYRADAAYFASQIIGQIWVDRANFANYVYRNGETACDDSTTAPTASSAVDKWLNQFAFTSKGSFLPGVSSGATSSKKPQILIDTTTSPTYATVTVTMCWILPNETQAHSHVTVARINN